MNDEVARVLLAAERWLFTRPLDYGADDEEMELGHATRAWIRAGRPTE